MQGVGCRSDPDRSSTFTCRRATDMLSVFTLDGNSASIEYFCEHPEQGALVNHGRCQPRQMLCAIDCVCERERKGNTDRQTSTQTARKRERKAKTERDSKRERVRYSVCV